MKETSTAAPLKTTFKTELTEVSPSKTDRIDTAKNTHAKTTAKIEIILCTIGLALSITTPLKTKIFKL
jgi:hypothetical protein